MIIIGKKLVFLLCFWSVVGFTQDAKLSVSLNYPISIGSPAFRDQFGGMNDVGLKYRYRKISRFSYGIICNLEHFDGRRDIDRIGRTRRTIVKPGLFIELNSSKESLIKPFSGLTYYSMSTGTSVGKGTTANGINGIVGVSCKIYDSVHIDVQYDYSRVLGTNISTTTVNKEYSMLKMGMEYFF